MSTLFPLSVDDKEVIHNQRGPPSTPVFPELSKHVTYNPNSEISQDLSTSDSESSSENDMDDLEVSSLETLRRTSICLSDSSPSKPRPGSTTPIGRVASPTVSFKSESLQSTRAFRMELFSRDPSPILARRTSVYADLSSFNSEHDLGMGFIRAQSTDYIPAYDMTPVEDSFTQDIKFLIDKKNHEETANFVASLTSSSSDPSGPFYGKVSWTHGKLGVALISPDPPSLHRILSLHPHLSQLSDVLVAVDLSMNVCTIRDASLLIHADVSFQISSSSPFSFLSAFDLHVISPSPSPHHYFRNGDVHTGFIYSWRSLFGFVKTSSELEVYIAKERANEGIVPLEEGHVVSFEAVWVGDNPQGKNVKILRNQAGIEVEATIIMIIERGVRLGIAVASGENSLRRVSAGADVAYPFSLSNDVVIFRLGVVKYGANISPLSDSDLIGQKCRVVVNPHVSGFWHGKSVQVNSIFTYPSVAPEKTDPLPPLRVVSQTDFEPNCRLQGIVTRLVKRNDREFGFLKCSGLNSEVYFHLGRVAQHSEPVNNGDCVEFTLIYSSTGQPQAKEIVKL
ncbi:hypothetical protein RCL1_002119 [Eukaryota sp. TZLM3-RCL]